MPIIARETERAEEDERLHRLRHSAAHLMAHAVQELHPGTHLAFGPAIRDGFYYDFDTEHRFTEDDLRKIEEKMTELARRGAEFVKKEIGKAKLDTSVFTTPVVANGVFYVTSMTHLYAVRCDQSAGE